ncbi:MAG: hypothetical protein NWE98_12175 [Candidatus Bathyarchaeota archaeon]|nr:hypothetical protein [Candidatus Bathyarchaeota archaeon]
MAVDFSVVQPQSWAVTYDFFFHIGQVKNITATLDGTLCSSFPYNSTDYSLLINAPPLGIHKLEVAVFSRAFYTTPMEGVQNIRSTVMYDGNYLFEYPIVVSDVVYFTTSSSSSDLPTHIPATPTPPQSSSPTNAPINNPTPYQTSNFPSPNPSSTPIAPEFQLAAALSLLFFASITLIYFKRRRGEGNK